MNELLFYLEQGVQHILDIQGWDHFYFIVSFCLQYTFRQWRSILGLVTAFTVGHCLTLLLSGFDLVSINPRLVEVLIPITILISCGYNFFCIVKETALKEILFPTYAILLSFGLIHGLGFSNYLKLMFFEGDPIVLPLLSFNVGIEIAQLVIVVAFLTVMFFLNKLPISFKFIKLLINSLILFLVLKMLLF